MTYKLTRDDVQRIAYHPSEFRKHLLIETTDGIRRLGDVLDPWQRADFEALDSAWMRAVGYPVADAPKFAYLERGRGHSKTSDLAVMVAWAVGCVPKLLKGASVAADQDQARLLRDAIDRLCRVNPHLQLPLDVQRDKVLNTETGSELAILSSDAASSFGLTLDFVTCDELTHWSDERGEKLWQSLFSAAPKKKNCLLLIISNAGLAEGTSWQWRVRESMREMESCYFSTLDGPQASWITAASLFQQQAILPPKAYARYWLNQWTTDGGDLLDSRDIEAAVRLAGPHEARIYPCYIAGLDYGLRHDRSALVVLGLNPDGNEVCLASAKAWWPSDYPDGEIPFADVEEEIFRLHKRLNFDALIYDPWNAAGPMQRVRDRGLYTIEWGSSSPKNQTLSATVTLSVFRNRQIAIYHDEELLADLRKMSIVERASGGFGLVAKRDKRGHSDLAFALASALPTAMDCVRQLYVQERFPVTYYSNIYDDYGQTDYEWERD